MNWKLGDVNCVTAGPWGGHSGTPWDDGVYPAVRQVVIGCSAGVNFIQFEYDENNHSIWCEKHGGIIGVIKTDKIKLDYPTEFLISIGGTCGSVTEGGGPVIVTSLCFESNMRKYGPFGVYKGTPFALAANTGKLVGFYGQSSSYLDSIGVYVKPLKQRGNLLEMHKMMSSTPVSPYQRGNMLETPKNHFDHAVGPMISTTPVNPYPHSSKKVVSFGPWGGDSGTIFDDGIYTGVREIQITRSGGLVSIRVCYDHNGRAVWARKNGGSAGLKLDKIVFDYPFEVLSQISGYYGSTILRGPTAIKSLTFHTNRRSYGPFGDQQGFSFSSGTSKGPIVGFHGTNGYFIHSIGVHVLEAMPLLSQPSYPDPYSTSPLISSEVAWGVPRQPAPYQTRSLGGEGGRPWEGVPREPVNLYESGPWGGEGGNPWDDGVYRGVRKILLTRGDVICSVQFEYDLNGRFVWTPIHGKVNDDCTYQIKFDYPYEVLTSISGYYDILPGDMPKRVVRSLTFHTNRTKYGPHGKTTGTYFSSANKDGKVVGFHGRSSYYLDAIGVHMQYWVSDETSHRHPYEKGSISSFLHKILP
ncbi:hypothetical protein RND81_06G060000 [Saponaria officinalis]|uniref:Jacalin-type lectin domain-containing protein n=1 Tax=Saponaria officinalis TaxID=3572 RepID=A0AAW1K6T5_SAPOF